MEEFTMICDPRGSPDQFITNDPDKHIASCDKEHKIYGERTARIQKLNGVLK